MKKTLLIAALGLAVSAMAATPAATPVAGSTPVSLTITEASQVALGWSVKKSLLGKTVYNEKGEKVGKVEDLIVAPDKNVSYVIVGAGGFIGMGRHDVAIAVTQIQEQGGRLVMAGATPDSIKAMAAFEYATDTARRDRFIATADQDIAKAKVKLAELEKKSAEATAAAKAQIDVQIEGLKRDLKSAEDGLARLKAASIKKWHEFEGDVSAATSRLRKSIDSAVG